MTTGSEIMRLLQVLYQAEVEACRIGARDMATRLAAATPRRTGGLETSYVVADTERGADVSALTYFWFVALGTGQRGAGSGVPPTLFPAGWTYGPKQGMVANSAMIAAMGELDAVMEIAEAQVWGSIYW